MFGSDLFGLVEFDFGWSILFVCLYVHFVDIKINIKTHRPIYRVAAQLKIGMC